MKRTTTERLSELIPLVAKNLNSFAREIDVSQGTISMAIKRNSNLGSDILTKIQETYPNVNTTWLLTGEGQPLIDPDKKHFIESKEPHAENNHGIKYFELTDNLFYMRVPIVPVEAQARYISECNDVTITNKENWEQGYFIVSKIGRGNYLSFEISGDSMDEEDGEPIPNGSVVLARELDKSLWKDKLHINKYSNWIIVTDETILCKQITKHDVEKGEITCHSLNKSPEYSDFTLCLNDVHELYNIVQVVKPNQE